MSVWNLKELRDLIERIHGSEQLSKAAPHINAVDWKLRSSSYHSYTASNAFASIFDEVENESSHAVRMMLSTGNEASDFHQARLIYEANVIACGQAMHSVSDIISHLILDALLLTGLNEDNLSLKSVQKQVPNCELKKQIIRVSGLQPFCYLHGFINTIKHVRLVDTEYSVDLTGEVLPSHGIRFKAFEYKGVPHNVKWGEEFLKELRLLSIEFVNLGQEINNFLRQNVS